MQTKLETTPSDLRDLPDEAVLFATLPMQNETLRARNAHLTTLLTQAGLDAEARAAAEQIQLVMIDELHHRMKNMLTIVTAIVRQSMRSATSVGAAESAINTRLVAMARAHDLLLKADCGEASLGDIAREATEQHNTAAGRIIIEGDDMKVAPFVILPLTLALNELCTNAIKYGALSEPGGKAEIK